MPTIIRGSDNFNTQPYATFPIGVPFPIWDHFAGLIVPDNTGNIKFIKLSSGDAYNGTLLINEDIQGSGDTLEITAEINLPESVLHGQIVHLVNTEHSFIRAGDSGEFELDQMQRITGRLFNPSTSGGLQRNWDSAVIREGALDLGSFDGGRWTGGESSDHAREILFNSANSPDARISATTEGETRPKNVQTSYYLRII